MHKTKAFTDPITEQPWTVRLVFKGDRYGAEDCLTHDKDQPLVEFYDLRYVKGFTPMGQFVSRYYLSTTLEGESGLNLNGGVPTWRISPDCMAEIRQWLMEVTR